MDLSVAQWVVLAATGFMHGFNKTGILGSAIITTPLLLMFFSPGESLGVVLPLLVFADILTLILLRRSACWPHILKALPWGVAGIVVGWLIARYAVGMGAGEGDYLLRKLIAVTLTLLIVGNYWAQYRAKAKRANAAPEPDAPGREDRPRAGTGFAAAMGVMGGVTTMLANNGGPAWVVYLSRLNLDVKQYLGTAAWLFFVQNLVKIPFAVSLGFVTPATLRANLYLLPAVAAGVFTGGLAVRKMSKEFFGNLTQIMALIGALYLLFT